MYMYHVSPTRNRKSIQDYGLQPTMSQGARIAVYLVRRNKIKWAVKHCSERHKEMLLDVWKVEIADAGELTATGQEGVYFIESRILSFQLTLDKDTIMILEGKEI